MCCENVYIVQSHGSFLVKVLWTPPPPQGSPQFRIFKFLTPGGGREEGDWVIKLFIREMPRIQILVPLISVKHMIIF